MAFHFLPAASEHEKKLVLGLSNWFPLFTIYVLVEVCVKFKTEILPDKFGLRIECFCLELCVYSTFFPWLVQYINKYHFAWLKSQAEEIVDDGEKVSFCMVYDLALFAKVNFRCIHKTSIPPLSMLSLKKIF